MKEDPRHSGLSCLRHAYYQGGSGLTAKGPSFWETDLDCGVVKAVAGAVGERKQSWKDEGGRLARESGSLVSRLRASNPKG